MLPERERLEDVSAATEPAVDQDRHLSSDRLDHLREGLDRTGAFLAPAAMVMLERFPRLKERRYELAGTLSGGERQMLALAKVLIRKPQLVLMDEPSIGLAPTVVEGLQRIVADISRDGLAVIAAEQNVSWSLRSQLARFCSSPAASWPRGRLTR